MASKIHMEKTSRVEAPGCERAAMHVCCLMQATRLRPCAVATSRAVRRSPRSGRADRLPQVVAEMDALFPLTVLDHASAIDIALPISPQMLEIFRGLDVAIVNCLRPGGADAIINLGEATRCNDHKSKHDN